MNRFLLGLLLFTALPAQKSPPLAILLSAVFPGGGQFYTENYLKGVVIGSAQASLTYLVIQEHYEAQGAKGGDSTESEAHRARRDRWLWWTAGVWVFSMADAYTSAHMWRFREQQSLSFRLVPEGFSISLRW